MDLDDIEINENRILVGVNVLFHQKCAMLRCCGYVWLPPIIFIGTHNLAPVETDSAKLCVMYGKKRCMLWMASLLSIHRILFLEQPIFTCKAHVFHIDPKTKRSWMSASSAAVSVSFFYDSSRNLYRIISVEGTKAVINSTITANMTFTKTSQKFGQWSDVRANTVYGLGFASEPELGKFIEKFQEVKEAIQAQQCGATGGKSVTNGNSGAATPVASATASPLLAGRATGGDEPPPAVSPAQALPKPEPEDMNVHQRAHSGGGYATVGRAPRGPLASAGAPAVIDPPPAESSEQQLRYENDRLKLALAQRMESGYATVGRAPRGPLATAGPPAVVDPPPPESIEQQLRYENDRLKLALAQSLLTKLKGKVLS
ncbi:hypothetical protein SFRURICE_012131 [Spodoptera frugiperda]|nr:hypothetical protein SFRURICE_012131 [Spodoptera frugiperda]